jgi:hypothetical protein
MSSLYGLRTLYGSCYVTEFPDGVTIPWRLLTLAESTEINQMLSSGSYTLGEVENEVFRLCVVNKSFVDNMYSLKAGVVTTVAQQVIASSAPQSLQDLDFVLNVQRRINAEMVHQIIGWVCTAFPAYKPEDLYALDYPTLMLRLAQAETKMLRSGILNQPFQFYDPQTVEQPQQAAPPPTPAPPKVKSPDLKSIFDQQRGIKTPSIPVTKQTVITNKDMVESMADLLGHEKDVVTLQQKTEETAKYYQEYLDQMARGEKVKIKTPEERKLEAEKRAAENKKKLDDQVKQARKNDAVELEQLKKVREQEKKRRSKRRV